MPDIIPLAYGASGNFVPAAAGDYVVAPSGVKSINAADLDLDAATSGSGVVLCKHQLNLIGSSSGYSGLRAPAAAGSNTWVLPAADGTPSQVLGTDGVGNLGWYTVGLVSNQWVIGGNALAATGIFGDTAGFDVHFYTNNTQWMALTTAGLLGIGTGITAPTYDVEMSKALSGGAASGIMAFAAFNTDAAGTDSRGGFIWGTTGGLAGALFQFGPSYTTDNLWIAGDHALVVYSGNLVVSTEALTGEIFLHAGGHAVTADQAFLRVNPGYGAMAPRMSVGDYSAVNPSFQPSEVRKDQDGPTYLAIVNGDAVGTATVAILRFDNLGTAGEIYYPGQSFTPLGDIGPGILTISCGTGILLDSFTTGDIRLCVGAAHTAVFGCLTSASINVWALDFVVGDITAPANPSLGQNVLVNRNVDGPTGVEVRNLNAGTSVVVQHTHEVGLPNPALQILTYGTGWPDLGPGTVDRPGATLVDSQANLALCALGGAVGSGNDLQFCLRLAAGVPSVCMHLAENASNRADLVYDRIDMVLGARGADGSGGTPSSTGSHMGLAAGQAGDVVAGQTGASAQGGNASLTAAAGSDLLPGALYTTGGPGGAAWVVGGRGGNDTAGGLTGGPGGDSVIYSGAGGLGSLPGVWGNSGSAWIRTGSTGATSGDVYIDTGLGGTVQGAIRIGSAAPPPALPLGGPAAAPCNVFIGGATLGVDALLSVVPGATGGMQTSNKPLYTSAGRQVNFNVYTDATLPATLPETDHCVVFAGAAAPGVCTLPLASNRTGQIYKILNADPAFNLTVAPSGGDTIVPGPSPFVLLPGQSAEVFSDGSATWYRQY